MKKLAKENIPFVRKEVSAAEAEKIFAANPYKQELIKEHRKRADLDLRARRFHRFLPRAARSVHRLHQALQAS
jgi:threonyl-tRNA synthetase